MTELLDTLFGLPLAMRVEDADIFRNDAIAVWNWQMSAPPRDLSRDLASLRIWFDPKARGGSIRARLSGLGEPPLIRSKFLREPIVVSAGSLVILAPEGRIAIDTIGSALNDQSSGFIYVTPDAAAGAVHVAYAAYRDWDTARLRDTIRLASGASEALRLPAIAALLLLLVNGSTTAATALRYVGRQSDDGRIDASVARIGNAFAKALDESDRDLKGFSISGGYAWTEAARRLPDALVHGDNGWYVVDARLDHVLDLIAHELSRSQRRPSVTAVMAAFDALVGQYRAELPTLAGLGLANESRSRTQKVRARLGDLIGERR